MTPVGFAIFAILQLTIDLALHPYKLIKIGAKVVSHGRYVIFQMAEVAIARQMFQEICGSSRSYGRSHHQR